MRAIINDISFGYKFVTKKAAIDAFHEWLDICKELMQQKVRRVQEIYAENIDTSLEVAEGYKIIQLVQEFKDREDRSRLLGILMNSRECPETDKKVYIDGKESKAGAAASEGGILISLNSNAIFETEKIKGEYKGEKIDIDNLSQLGHIKIHAGKLGIRYYEPNKKHGPKAYIRAGGVKASEMDLKDDAAQVVLDRALEVDGRLYGYCDGCFYEFKKTEKNTYHGYKNEDLSKELKKKIMDQA